MALTFNRGGKRAAAEPPPLDPYGFAPSEPISVVEIPRLDADPEHARLSAQHNVLARAIEQRQQIIERYAINAELAANSTLATGPRKTILRERLARLDQFPSGIPERPPEPEAEASTPP
jgi:hypothetical protein